MNLINRNDNELKYIPIASDHAGFELKEYIREHLSQLGYMLVDKGTYSSESVDYPDFVHPLSKQVNDGYYEMGIVICGSGNGVAMVANKYPNVRCALCWNEDIAKLARNHNNANIISLPARFITKELALNIVLMFLNSEYEAGRHQIRVEKINIK
ncbi:MAG: ribose 5-phosphate isomerase B [Bacteroidales bacterium]|nr:ribose 5-phosphate isomerase B [Bacteroidales bacterium]